MHTGSTPWKMKADWNDAAGAKKKQRLPENHQKLGERPGTVSPSPVLRRNQPYQYFDVTSSLQNHETVNSI